MTDTYDVIVIGAGPAGENAAGRVVDGGLTAAIVERELVGGECSYWGCMPSKTLIRPGDVLAQMRRTPGVVGGHIDIEAALARRDWMISDLDDSGQVPWLEGKGIPLFRGQGRVTGERTVSVTSSDGSVRTLTATRAVVVATGTRAIVPGIPGLAEAKPWDNREATTTKEIPRRLLVLGGGAIGAELAQAMKRLGAEEVTVMDGAPRLLGREEPFAGEQVQAAMEAEGITVVTGVSVNGVHREGPDGPVTATLGDGRTFVGDEILVAVGRRASTTDIGLESVGLTPGTFIEVDDRLRAVGIDGDWLYAVGDCNGVSLLTHMGKYQARLAGDVILGKDVRDEASHDMVPRVTFTDPQVCAVGLTEEQAITRGLRIRCVEYGTGDVAGSSVLGEKVAGTAKIVVDEDRGVIVGATFTGSELQELLHSATIAIVGAAPLTRLWHAVPSYPTVSEVWLRLLEAYGL